MTLALALTIISGICWVGVYAEIIRLGVKFKTVSMPMFALMLNICWECIYSIDGLIHIGQGDHSMEIISNAIVNVIWFLADLVVLYFDLKFKNSTLIKFHIEPKKNRLWNNMYTFLIFGVSLAMQLAFYFEFKNAQTYNYDSVDLMAGMAAVYSAFLQNAAMSILFLLALYSWTDLRGQNLTIGILKLVGTLAPAILFGLVYKPENILVIICGSLCLLFDTMYVIKIIKNKYWKKNKIAIQ